MNTMIKVAAMVAGLVGSTMVFALEGDVLQMEVQKMVNEDLSGGANVTATVEDNTKVFLSGYMEQQDQIDNLITKLKQVDGVTDVQSTVTTVD